ncbi:MAG TPA: amidohydrolase family protein [Pseudolabrys sp.]|nr:amidohydrolase family protein [Pseudolabrys sp.]
MANRFATCVVALEEHYWDRDLVAHFPGREGKRLSEVEKRLHDITDLRIKEMDEAGIDVQVLSHGAPGTQKMQAGPAVQLTRQANDRLAEIVKANPQRFAALAILPTPDPKAAADELERTVTKLGFKGAMVHGLTDGKFIDDKQFWPIFERAAALDVPIYLHPSFPHPAVTEVYYKDYLTQFPEFVGPALGFTVEAATQGVRMVLSGIFDAYPNLQVILGHLGEGLPFLLGRIDETLSRPGNRGGSFRDAFCSHFHLTTSGNFSTNALVCSMMEMGVDRIMFSVDWPFASNTMGARWLESTPISAEDKGKIFGGNARRLLRL